jgi:hypothetical protein
MLWFFQKQDARVHYEIRRQSDGYGFELVITREDGRQQIERFPDARTVAERSRLLHDSLIASGWRPPATASGLDSPTARTNVLSTRRPH